jgi:AcrR family transcriptional regulator
MANGTTLARGPKANSRDAILDAAERLFANSGFDGTSMRSIAEAADVAQALLHYHFGTKERLFAEMFTRRSEAINAARIERLDSLFARGMPTLEEVLDTLLRPLIELGHDESRGGSYFSRLVVSVAADRDPRSCALIADNYDPLARRFISAVMHVLPGLNETDAVRGYLFVIGVGMTIMAPTGRLNRLSGGRCNDADIDSMVEYAVPFAAAGLRRFSASHSEKRRVMRRLIGETDSEAAAKRHSGSVVKVSKVSVAPRISPKP